MLSQEQIDFFHANGYVNGGKVLSDEEVDVLRSEIMRTIEERDRTDVPQPVMVRNLRDESSPVWQIVDIWMSSEPFHQLIAIPRSRRGWRS